MSIKVFYAWQMDRPSKLCRWFIHEAVETAVKKASSDLQVDDAPAIGEDDREQSEDKLLELDEGVKNEVGTPHIAETILRKIKSCGAFVADVSLVADMTSDEKKRKKSLPNPNVLVELGAAIAWRGWDRIILVMNSAFGPPEQLPFDLRHRSVCTYNLAEGSDRTQRNAAIKGLAGIIRKKLGEMRERGLFTPEADEAVDRAAARAANERSEFEAAVMEGDFYNVAGDFGLVAVSIFPAITPKQRLVFGSSKHVWYHDKLHPIVGSGRITVEHRPKSVVCKSVLDGMTESATELKQTGLLLAVLNASLHYDVQNAPTLEKPWPFQLLVYQREIVAGIGRYLLALRELGVIGPWYIGLSLLKMHKCIFYVTEMWHTLHDRGRSRPFDEVDMTADMLLIHANQDLEQDAIANALKPAFIQFWRHCGFTGMPVVEGNSVRWEE